MLSNIQHEKKVLNCKFTQARVAHYYSREIYHFLGEFISVLKTGIYDIKFFNFKIFR